MNEAKKIYTMDELKKIMAENNPNPKTGDFEDLLKYEDEDTVPHIMRGNIERKLKILSVTMLIYRCSYLKPSQKVRM